MILLITQFAYTWINLSPYLRFLALMLLSAELPVSLQKTLSSFSPNTRSIAERDGAGFSY